MTLDVNRKFYSYILYVWFYALYTSIYFWHQLSTTYLLKVSWDRKNNHPSVIVDVIRHEKAISKNNVIE